MQTPRSRPALPAEGSILRRLLDGPIRPGRLAWIGLRPGRREPVQIVAEAVLVPGKGLVGDRFRGRAGAAREVTLVAAEDLVAMASFLGLDAVAPERLRRNLVVEGVNLAALRRSRFRIGDALLEGSGPCDPCSRLEEEFGPGGYNAALQRGGITARVLEGGSIRLGDAVIRADAEGGPNGRSDGRTDGGGLAACPGNG